MTPEDAAACLRDATVKKTDDAIGGDGKPLELDVIPADDFVMLCVWESKSDSLLHRVKERGFVRVECEAMTATTFLNKMNRGTYYASDGSDVFTAAEVLSGGD